VATTVAKVSHAGRQPPSPASGRGTVDLDGRCPVSRPGLDYQHAFDLCAMEVRRRPGPVALFARSSFHGLDLLKRLGGCEVVLVPLGDEPGSLPGNGGSFRRPTSARHGGWATTAGTAVHSAIWIEPDFADERVLRRMRMTLMPGGTLYLVVSGYLARLRRGVAQDRGWPIQRPAGWRRTMRWLREAGFTVTSLYGFQGAESLTWACAARLAEHLGRDDLADRCHFRMRAEYVVTGRLASVATVAMIVARRRSASDGRERRGP
jgi:hypothetical protein